MGIVDTVMVGHLPDSARAIGSVSISSNLSNVLAFFGGGLLIGLDTLVAQAFGADRREDCHRSLVNSIYLSIVMTPFLMVPVWFFDPLLHRLHIEPQVAALAVPATAGVGTLAAYAEPGERWLWCYVDEAFGEY